MLVLGNLLRKLPSLLMGLSFSDCSFPNFLEQLKLLLQGLCCQIVAVHSFAVAVKPQAILHITKWPLKPVAIIYEAVIKDVFSSVQFEILNKLHQQRFL